MRRNWTPYASEAIHAMMNGESARSINKRLGIPISLLTQWHDEFLESLTPDCRRLICRNQAICEQLRLLRARKRLFES